MNGDDARTESALLSPVVSSRTLSRLLAKALPPTLDRVSSRPQVQHTRVPSLRRMESGRTAEPLPSSSQSPKRPSTAVAATTHSRIHQALRRSESEFVFSSKRTTMDGILYSSRFQQTALARPASSQPRVKLGKRFTNSMTRDNTTDPATASPLRPVSVIPQHPFTHSASSVTPSEPPTTNVDHNDKPLRSSAPPQRRLHHETTTVAMADTQAPSVPETAVVVAARHHDDAAYVQRKRRCARTFEEMILARIQATTVSKKLSPEYDGDATASSNQAQDAVASGHTGIDKLLANGIIPSLLSLGSLSDQATQTHCCRSLYYLSRVHAARKPMVAHGVIATIKQLARTATAMARQDLAATLCHLCEECDQIETLLFEGIDRCLVRLVALPHPETKRICALTVLNISSDASKIKHFVEPFAQLLITSTKSSYGHTAASGYLLKAVYNVARLPMFHASLLGENIPRFLAAQIPHVAHDIQILALQALVSLCDAKPNRAQILSQAFCKLLEQMVTVDNLEVQETALLVVLLLSQDDGARIKLCNWIPVATLIATASAHLQSYLSPTMTTTMTTEPDKPLLVFLDSCILRNLCDSVLTHHELLEEDVLPLLLAMSRVTDHDIKSNAVCALVSIIASSPDESAAFVVAMLDELITLTRSTQLRICVFAVGAVYNVACNDDCLPMLVQSPELLDCLLELAHDRDAMKHSVAELTAAVIYRLLTQEDQEPATRLLQRGFFPALVRLVRVFPSARPYALQALYLLASSEQGTAAPLFPHGSDGIWDLVCALNYDDTEAREDRTKAKASDVATARSAVSLVAELARQRVNHSFLVRNGAVFRFLKSLRRVARLPSELAQLSGIDCRESALHDDETIAMNSAHVFYSLAVAHDGCEQLIRAHGIEELIHIARTAKLADSTLTHRVKELVMMTLCRVSSFLGLEVRLIEHGAIDAVLVLALVSSADSTAIKALCVKTLANCLVAKNCARPLIEHGVIWALASLAVVDSPETRAACAVSLCNLATVPHMLLRFLDAGAPRALVHLLQKSEHDPATALIVVKAIANLVAHDKLCLAFVNDDIEKHLGVFFASPASCDEMRQLAAMVLLRVTSANDAVVSLDHLRHGVFVWMEEIITMEDDALVKNCLLTVHDLTCSSTIDVAELDVDHILRIVIQVVQRHVRSDDVLTLCLWIIYNLSCQYSVLAQLVRPEILSFLRNHVPSGSSLPFPSTAATPANTPPLQSVGVVVPVTQQLDAKLCGFILHNLSCAQDNHGVLASLVNARCVAMLCDLYVQRDDLKETCAVAACNLAVGRVNSTRVVDDRAGEMVIHFVCSDLVHRCHYRLVSVAIRKIVNAPGNQARLLDRGIARAIVRLLERVSVETACADGETTRNLVASLCVLSKCGSHLPRLLKDDTLPIVIAVSEVKCVVGGTSAMSSEILSYCFEILSELCSIDFEAYGKKGDKADGEINVVNTLTRLSELHQLTSQTNPVAVASALCYYDRGDGSTKALAFAQLLTCMKKTPTSTNSVKKNLELQATFQVPARKWMPDATATPREPPPLECYEIPLTEGSQTMPDEIKQRIKGLPTIGKELLVRDERFDSEAAVAVAIVAQQQPNNGSPSPAPDGTESSARGGSHSKGIEGATPLTSSRHRPTPKKQLQRGLAGRNLALTTSTSLLLP